MKIKVTPSSVKIANVKPMSLVRVAGESAIYLVVTNYGSIRQVDFIDTAKGEIVTSRHFQRIVDKDFIVFDTLEIEAE